MWTAVKGGGAFCNDVPISVDKKTDLKDCVIASSGPTANQYIDVPKFRYNLQKKVFRLTAFFKSVRINAGCIWKVCCRNLPGL